MTITPCPHTRAESYWISDARGIPLARVCTCCEPTVRERYRADVLTDPDYWHDEPIEAEEY